MLNHSRTCELTAPTRVGARSRRPLVHDIAHSRGCNLSGRGFIPQLGDGDLVPVAGVTRRLPTRDRFVAPSRTGYIGLHHLGGRGSPLYGGRGSPQHQSSPRGGLPSLGAGPTTGLAGRGCRSVSFGRLTRLRRMGVIPIDGASDGDKIRGAPSACPCNGMARDCSALSLGVRRCAG